ncbi:hypothetical protein HDU76_013632 [Blyttiomyces sp. JEL0837]|nr:hypothetical protein HDU76_013632 [Blyttiomyces sp. JEL0837]
MNATMASAPIAPNTTSHNPHCHKGPTLLEQISKTLQKEANLIPPATGQILMPIPRHRVPNILSERYRRSNLRAAGFSKPDAEHADDGSTTNRVTTADTSTSASHAPVAVAAVSLPPLKRVNQTKAGAGRGGHGQNSSSGLTGGIGGGGITMLANSGGVGGNETEIVNGGGGNNAIDSARPGGRDKSREAVTLDPEESYTPFKLSDKSSFNPEKRAKYDAYKKPPVDIVNQIDRSCVRAKRIHKEQRRRFLEQVETVRESLARKGGIVSERESILADENSRKATERMRTKLKTLMEARDAELQQLVEGQKNSIDAIRLKEYLLLRPVKLKVGKTYTERDRLRVEELLAGQP